MPEIVRIDIESKEIPQSQAAWLGGVFEARGGIGFNIDSRKGEIVNSYPYLQVNSTNSGFIDSFQQRFGGEVKILNNSYNWRLRKRYEVVNLISSMKPFIPSRQEAVLAVENWLATDDLEERIGIAQDMKGYPKHEKDQNIDYTNLLQNPYFLAGIIDVGSIRRTPKSPTISVISTNIPLINGLETKFGGILKQISVAGDVFYREGRTATAHSDSYEWRITNRKARSVISQVRAYLINPPYEGWNDLPGKDKRLEFQLKNDEVLQFITDEIASFRRGEIDKITTINELTKQFSIPQRRVLKILDRLAEEVRSERYKFSYNLRRKPNE
jgi:hypothetical protein